MISALSFLSHFIKTKKLSACPIFIGPNTEIVEVVTQLIEKKLGKSSQTLQAKDSESFFKELQISFGQKTFFSSHDLVKLTGCTPKFLEKSITYRDLFSANFMLNAPKLPYKSPLISKLEATRKFIVLTCFVPSTQELISFSESYIDNKTPEFKALFKHLPQQLPALIDELDKIKLVGINNYTPDHHPADQTLDTILFNFLSHHEIALNQISQLSIESKTEPTFMLKSFLYQLRKLKVFIQTPPQKRFTLKMNKMMTKRFESLLNKWTPQQLSDIEADLYDTEYKMRLNPELAPLILERSLSEIFILSQTKLS